jgi:hypothetical protein
MPHIDEMLGVAAVATAGLFVAIALQPADDIVAARATRAQTAVASAPGAPPAAAVEPRA